MEDLRRLPKVDALSRNERLAGYPERVRTEAARQGIDRAREALLAGGIASAEDEAVNAAELLMAYTTKRVINASGVILHTGLGRARLAPSVVDHLAEVASSHAVVEYDLDSGSRGDRQEHVRGLLAELTGAEDALVVNNAAAGLILTLSALVGDGDVVLSRGQMVEIGGSFRIPDIIRQSGCNLVEVGCTNKTRLSDYQDALHPFVAILRCHTSNYKIIGFTAQPSLEELVGLASEFGTTVIDDQGTGCLVDTSRFGMAKIPTVQDSVAAGADVVIASCDKLLGGPQGGMIVGSREAIQAIAKHPLARAFRVDKLTIAALEATLRLYVQGRETEIPTIRAISIPIEEVKAMAEDLCPPGGIVSEGITEIGGGSSPGTGVRTYRVGLQSPNADILSRDLRVGDPAIITRIEDGRVWLDPRTMDEGEVEIVKCRLKSLGC
ncbi:MAG TPA: L-seryl-tRNA(Sec) selenium transferase [Fimbriimonas sp.]|nr:L-seryl-tRNA(Sec) selenium transferase [Fimbriimonas sp.]